MTRTLKVVCWIALSLALACGGATDPESGGPPPLLERLPRALTGAEQATIAASNHFAFDLLGKATAAEPAKNVFLSPLSVSMALGMVMNGARGATRDAMAATLGFGAAPQAEINDGYRSLTSLLAGLDQQVQFTIANSLWTRLDYPILPPFLADARQFFDAEARALDFGSPAALDTINGWVNRKTNGKIPTILSSIRPEEVLFAINAIYFKGLWLVQFKPSETARRGRFIGRWAETRRFSSCTARRTHRTPAAPTSRWWTFGTAPGPTR